MDIQKQREKLSLRNTIYMGSLLFGLFFGAGNLIFPIMLGQLAGRNTAAASAGLLITGVGLPLAGIAAMGMSQSKSLYELASGISKKYAMFFSCALYLTIGPFFAIPRTATVSFNVGVLPMLQGHEQTALFLFSVCFFAIVLFFSLRPTKIMTWVGKLLNPIFLVLLGILLIQAFIQPMGDAAAMEPLTPYAENSFLSGFLEGYNTMDALASLAFGVIIIDAVKKTGIKTPKKIAGATVKAGVFCAAAMGVIYTALAFVGAQSRGGLEQAPDGGTLLYQVAVYYFDKAGGFLLAAIVTVACLKTSIGLVTSCSTAFMELFPGKMKYQTWAVLFSMVSFAFANFGLNQIIQYSIPVLMFLYPLTITLIIMGLCSQKLKNKQLVLKLVTGFTVAAALFDFIKALPQVLIDVLHLDILIQAAGKVLPFYSIGLGWILPAGIGLLIGILVTTIKGRRQTS